MGKEEKIIWKQNKMFVCIKIDLKHTYLAEEKTTFIWRMVNMNNLMHDRILYAMLSFIENGTANRQIQNFKWDLRKTEEEKKRRIGKIIIY